MANLHSGNMQLLPQETQLLLYIPGRIIFIVYFAGKTEMRNHKHK